MRRSIKEHIRRKIIIILSILLIASSGTALWHFLQPLELEKDIPACKYTQQAQVNYLVHFKPNNYFDEPTAGPGRGYITSLTDYIETQLVYQLKGDRPASVQGDMQVIARLSGYILQNKAGDTGEKEKIIIWEKTTPLLPLTPYSGDARTEIKQIIPIQLNQFRDFANEVNTTFYNPTDAVELTVFYNITATVTNDQGISTSQVCPQLVIPIQGNAYAIGGSLTDKKDNIINVKKMVEVPGAKTARQVSVGVTILLTLLLLLILFATTPELEDPAARELRTIIKKHGDRIVAGVFNLPVILEQDTLILQSFYDLVKVADEVAQPILYENVQEGVHSFFVINESRVYTYSLEVSSWNRYNNETITGTEFEA
ncbi:MAG TPA: hypothetical protein DER33_03955 [Syntrophomonas sp.]|nr:hypothetical protein [Syntrophomonas sp.]